MPDFAIEDGCAGPVCGIDEAGRGPLAGPVVAAAVILDRARVPDGLDDSKKLSAKRRAALFEALARDAEIGVGVAGVAEIERINILNATLAAMARADDSSFADTIFASTTEARASARRGLLVGA